MNVLFHLPGSCTFQMTDNCTLHTIMYMYIIFLRSWGHRRQLGHGDGGTWEHGGGQLVCMYTIFFWGDNVFQSSHELFGHWKKWNFYANSQLQKCLKPSSTIWSRGQEQENLDSICLFKINTVLELRDKFVLVIVQKQIPYVDQCKPFRMLVVANAFQCHIFQENLVNITFIF